jgi:hypothetical protein
MRKTATVVAGLAALAVWAPAAVAAPVETVTNLDDAGPGSLRQAVADVDAGGTVAFAPSLSGTITLTSGEIEIGKGVTVDGPGAQQLTVSGNDSSRIFNVNTADDVTVEGLTLTEGRNAPALMGARGGAVAKFGAGTLTVRDSAITDSTASANASGALGGGLLVDAGGLVLERVVLAGNRAEVSSGQARGGALEISVMAGAARLTNVTITGNSTNGSNSDIGGGISIINGFTAAPVVLEQVTIAGNSADIGGGLYTSVAPELVNTIVADNTATNQAPDCKSDVGTTVVVRGTSLIEQTVDCVLSGSGTVIFGADPRLGPLALNAPGQTETMALGAGSPALDAAPISGDGACPPPTTDQRGVTRPQGSACDLGAFEARAAVASLTPSAHDFGVVPPGDGPTAPVSFTLANDDDAELDLTIDLIARNGADSDQFGLDTTDCPATLTPGASCDIEATFDPTSTGQKQVTLAAESSGGDVSAALTGFAPAALETVTTLADAGPGSLRGAIADVAPGGTVAFAAGLSGTITLTSGEIPIGKGVTVAGPGAQRLTVSGNDSSRIFNVNTAGDVTVEGVTLTKGFATSTVSNARGGAVTMSGAGTLTVRDSAITDSTARVAGSFALAGWCWSGSCWRATARWRWAPARCVAARSRSTPTPARHG